MYILLYFVLLQTFVLYYLQKYHLNDLYMLEENNIPMASAEVTMIPQTYVKLTDEQDIKNINRTLDLLDEDDDVQNVYTNWDEEDELR